MIHNIVFSMIQDIDFSMIHDIGFSLIHDTGFSPIHESSENPRHMSIGPDIVIIFLIISLNICFVCSIRPFEYPHLFLLMNQKIKF